MMNLYPHQESFLKDNPNKALLAWSVGLGKSYCMRKWIEARPGIKFLVVVPKKIKSKTVADLAGLNIIVKTKEEVKKFTDNSCTGLVIDEAHHTFSPLFMKGRSALTEHIYNYIKKNSIHHILLCTATPFGNNAFKMHTALTFINKAEPWHLWKERFYELKMLPYLPRPAYFERKGWRLDMVNLIKGRVYFASHANLNIRPEPIEEVFEVKTPKITKLLSDTPVGQWHEKSRAATECKEKLEWVQDFIENKSKIVIVSRYKSSIEYYKKHISKTRYCLELTGDTKNPKEVVDEANSLSEVVVFMSADIAEGFELPTFAHMLFLNLSFKCTSLIQTKGRIDRINFPKQVYYTYIHGCAEDKHVYKNVHDMETDFTIS